MRAVRKIIPGSIALDKERKIAEAIAARSAELRKALSKEGEEYNAYLAKCAKEKREAEEAVVKTQKQLTALKADIVRVSSHYYDEKRAWLKGKKENDALREELVAKLREAKTHAETLRVTAEAVTQLETRLKKCIAIKETAVNIRETLAIARETAAKKIELKNVQENERLHNAIFELSKREKEYAVRINALIMCEKRAEAVIAKETSINAEERRIDLKAKVVQDKDKGLQIERVGLARERARLGRIKHKLQGVAK